MSYAARRKSEVSILSMLDLLFGLFGAMIILAALLNFLRVEETSKDQTQFVFVEFQVHSDTLDLSRLFIDFTLKDNGYADRALPLRLKHSASSAFTSYHVGATPKHIGGHVFLPGHVLEGLSNPMLRPTLENIPYLKGDDSGSLDVFFVIRTAHNSCVDRAAGLKLSQIIQSEKTALANELAPSLFQVIKKSGSPLCIDDGGDPGLDFTNEVTADGWLRLNYRSPEDGTSP